MTRRRTTTLTRLVTTGAMIAGLGAAVLSTPASADEPGGALVDEVVWDGLEAPTVVRFAPDGRVVVAELPGTIKVYDSVTDRTPTTSGDEEWEQGEPTTLQARVHNYLDRGLIGMALDPDFPEEPWVYVSYAYNHRPGTPADAVPAYANPDQPAWDPCPGPGDGTIDCAAEGRISRMRVEADGSIDTTQEQVLVGQGYCFVHPSHSMGALEFGDDGYLYASAGEGASFEEIDAGGTAGDVCADPRGEGGALRSQDLRLGSDPVGLDGAVLRLDPDTGEAAPDNPRAASADANARRIVAHGMRNPFRFAVRTPPGGSTPEVWIGDVGWDGHEEVNRVPVAGPVDNLGWPCFEGTGHQPRFDAADIPACEDFYADEQATPGRHAPPWWTYEHDQSVLPGGDDTCSTQTGSISTVAFLDDPPYPDRYDGALVVGDYARRCLWMMPAGADGDPDPTQVEELAVDPGHVVMAEQGPGGKLFYVEIFSEDPDGAGKIHRLTYDSDNRAPTADVTADRTSGPAPLTVDLDGSGSSDPDNDPVSFAWDLDGDGTHDDATGARVTHTFSEPDPVTVSLQVTDPEGESDVDTVEVQPGNSAPVMTIESPGPGTVTFGDQVTFRGSATDAQDGDLAPSSITWVATTRHCPPSDDDVERCHQHPLQTFPETAEGDFTVPSHDLPSHILLTATATDSRGLTHRDSVRLDLAAPPDEPPTVQVTDPAEAATYAVGRRVRFAATADDPETGPLPASALDWTLERVRCDAGDCTTRVVERWSGVDGGTFRPRRQPQDASLRLSVTARDVGGHDASDSVALTPRRSRQVFRSRGAPARLTVAGESARGRLVKRLVVGSRVRVIAPRAVRVRGERRRFVRWSDGQRRRHLLVVPGRDGRLVARYRR